MCDVICGSHSKRTEITEKLLLVLLDCGIEVLSERRTLAFETYKEIKTLLFDKKIKINISN